MWSMLPASGRVVHAVLALALAGTIVFVLARAVRGDRAAAALGVGSLLAALPVCAMVADDRNLLIPGFGAFGVLAIAMERVWSASKPLLARVTVTIAAVLHLVIAPFLLPLRAYNSVTSMRGLIVRGADSMPSDEGVNGKILMVIGTPDVLMTSYMALERLLDDRPRPAHTIVMTNQDRGMAIVERTGESIYEIRNELGQNGGPFSGVYSDKRVEVGRVYRQLGIDVEVLEVGPDGLPRAIRFTFTEPLDQYRFVVWQGRSFIEVPLLEIGEKRSFESADLLSQLQ
jgi:hypothetical protein